MWGWGVLQSWCFDAQVVASVAYREAGQSSCVADRVRPWQKVRLELNDTNVLFLFVIVLSPGRGSYS